MKIKLSKSQWEEVGKKAGWINKISQNKPNQYTTYQTPTVNHKDSAAKAKFEQDLSNLGITSSAVPSGSGYVYRVSQADYDKLVEKNYVTNGRAMLPVNDSRKGFPLYQM